MKTIVALFDHYDEADEAVQALYDYGVDSNRISIVTRENDTIRRGTSAGPAAATGATAGGLVGLIAGISAVLIPGVGPVIATGTIAGALATTLGMTAVGAGVGAATGGLLGVLVDLGYPKKDAEFYAEGVKRGGVLVSVQTDETQPHEQINDILRDAGAVDIDTRRQAWQTEGWTNFDETEQSGEENYRRL
jgi:uncharacterized membrane protein